MQKIRRHTFLRGVAISGTAIANTFDLQKGAPHIRVFAGAAKGISDSEARVSCIEGLEECCDYVGKQGVFLGIENHGGIVAQSAGLLEIVRAVKSPWLGINLDSGNFHTDDPYADFAVCAPYAVNVQIKLVMNNKDNLKSPADYERIAQILNEARY